MKLIIQKLWILMAMVWVSISASAYDFEADGIYYLADVSDMTATVTSGDNPYEGDLVIPETTSYKGREFVVTSIESRTFQNCQNLKSLKLPESILNIGAGAFMNCSSLKSVNIPQNIDHLPSECFRLCSSLESISLPTSIIELGSESFADCISLKFISIPNSVTSIGKRSFLNCKSLTSITLPNTIKILSKELFHNCSKLTEFTIPNSVELIEDGTFENCKELSDISIPARVRRIGNGVFNGCGGLVHVYFEVAPTSISVGYKEANNTIKTPLFEDCPLSNVVIGRNINSDSRDRNNTIVGCFSGNPNLSKVILDGYISTIEEGAFRNCINLKSVEIPRSVISIGEWAFASSGLEKVTFEDGYKLLNLSLCVSDGWEYKTPKIFSGCNIEYLYLGRNLQIEGASQRPGYGGSPVTFFPKTLKQIVIGDFVNNIDVLLMNNQVVGSSLSNYPNLVAVQFGEDLLQLPSMEYNELLELLSISSTVPPSANPFTNSQYMDLNVEVPEGAIVAYQEAPIWKNFWNISQNENLLQCIDANGIRYRIIPDKTLEVIKKDTEYTDDINIPSKVEYNGASYVVASVGEAFEGCSKLTSITIPSTVHSLADNCFNDCVSLQTVVLKDGLESIGTKAFNNCKSLKTLSVPSSVDVFGEKAFDNCELDSLIFEDGENGIRFPSVDCSYTDITASGSSIQKTYKSYFGNTTIRNLYIGRNILNIYSPYNDGRYYVVFQDPFYNVPNLESITIGPHVSKIGSDDFEALYGGTINNYRSFGGCTHIKNVRVENNNPPINAIFSNNVYSEASLNVPENTISLYQETEGWKEFKNIFDGTEPVLVEDIILNANELSLEIGDTFQLTAEVLPEDATDQTIIWESSSPDSVIVDETGLLTALYAGSATIIARSADGNCEASCLVTVKAKENSVELIGLYSTYSVYNLQGIKILESEDVDKVKQLPSGVYIVNGKKLIIK